MFRIPTPAEIAANNRAKREKAEKEKKLLEICLTAILDYNGDECVCIEIASEYVASVPEVAAKMEGWCWCLYEAANSKLCLGTQEQVDAIAAGNQMIPEPKVETATAPSLRVPSPAEIAASNRAKREKAEQVKILLDLCLTAILEYNGDECVCIEIANEYVASVPEVAAKMEGWSLYADEKGKLYLGAQEQVDAVAANNQKVPETKAETTAAAPVQEAANNDKEQPCFPVPAAAETPDEQEPTGNVNEEADSTVGQQLKDKSGNNSVTAPTTTSSPEDLGQTGGNIGNDCGNIGNDCGNIGSDRDTGGNIGNDGGNATDPLSVTPITGASDESHGNRQLQKPAPAPQTPASTSSTAEVKDDGVGSEAHRPTAPIQPPSQPLPSRYPPRALPSFRHMPVPAGFDSSVAPPPSPSVTPVPSPSVTPVPSPQIAAMPSSPVSPSTERKLTAFTVCSEVQRETAPLPAAEATAVFQNLLQCKVTICSTQGKVLVKPYGFHGLIETAHRAFSRHYGLVLTPDDIWFTVLQGFARIAQAMPELCDSTLIVDTTNKPITIEHGMLLVGNPESQWVGSLKQFSDYIRKEIGENTHNKLVANFSTTGPLQRAACEFALMDTVQPYYTHKVKSECGIPYVMLQGTSADWKNLAAKVQSLALHGQLDWWLSELYPIMHEFVAASQDNVNSDFWNSLYKSKSGSGGINMTGWLLKLLPFVRDEDQKMVANPLLDHKLAKSSHAYAVEHLDTHCVNSSQLPASLSAVPFLWKKQGQLLPYRFVLGIVGYNHNPGNLALKPVMGWAVCPAVEDNKQ